MKKAKTTNIDKLCTEKREMLDSGDIAESLNDHFISIGKKLASEIPETVDSPAVNLKELSSDQRFRFRYITKSKVFSLIEKLKNGKATGLDYLPDKVLKLSKNYISSSLADIFNASIRPRIFPDDFKLGKVTLIHKTGAKDDPGNYRPISVLPSIARLFEKLSYDQLYDYFIKNKLFGEEQWGFRSLHSTALAFSKCSNDWIINIVNQNWIG